MEPITHKLLSSRMQASIGSLNVRLKTQLPLLVGLQVTLSRRASSNHFVHVQVSDLKPFHGREDQTQLKSVRQQTRITNEECNLPFGGLF